MSHDRAPNPFIDNEAMESDSEEEQLCDEQRAGEMVEGIERDREIDAPEEVMTSEDEAGEQRSVDAHPSSKRVGEPAFLRDVITKFGGKESNDVEITGTTGCGRVHDVGTDDESEDDDEEEQEETEWYTLIEEGMDLIARMATLSDAPLWAVRVFNGQEQDTFWVIHERLALVNNDPLAAFYRPEFKGWIVIESRSEGNVISLCNNISTIPQPPQISLIPLLDRAEWLRPQRQCKRRCPIMLPAWGRFRSRSVLKSLNLPTWLLRYAGDVVTVTSPSDGQKAYLTAIPRLPVKTKGRRSKHLRRLLHPHVLPPNQTRMQDPEKDPLDPARWWLPTKNHELVPSNLSPWISRLKDKRFQGLYAPPFAYMQEIPTDALEFDVKPVYSDLFLFYEGYCVATGELGWAGLDNKDFWEWTFDQYSAPPLEIGDRVAMKQENGEGVVGHVLDIRYDEVELEHELHAVPITLENIYTHKLRREFRLGDAVIVQWRDSPHHRRKGWVLHVQGTIVDILDLNTKEQFSVHRWQIRFDDLTEEPEDLGGRIDKPDRSKNKEMRSYDRLSELNNVKVIIVGHHPYKGWKGRVRMHAGRNLMRVEFESGARVVDVHINHLLSSEPGGLDLRYYHDQNLWTPPSCYATNLIEVPSQPKETIPEAPRALTPMLEPEDTSRIRYEDQELPADWLMDDALAQKRIWVHVRNTRPDPFSVDPGFQHGNYDDARGLVHSITNNNKAEVRLTHRNTTQHIPVRYLFPERPTKKKQKVVVLEGDHKGQVFSTGELTVDGMVPLFRAAAKRSDLTIEAAKLARID